MKRLALIALLVAPTACQSALDEPAVPVRATDEVALLAAGPTGPTSLDVPLAARVELSPQQLRARLAVATAGRVDGASLRIDEPSEATFRPSTARWQLSGAPLNVCTHSSPSLRAQ